jgi:DNA-directed RNA polymerase specialized sigma24 family protein
MRYFAGMTESEIADVLGIAERTVRRDWEKARLLLAQALSWNCSIRASYFEAFCFSS